MQPNPLDPVASERLSHAGQVFTSDLSINEFALGQVVSSYGPTIMPNIDAALELLETGAGPRF
jgi:hypothetical protein